MNTTLPSVYHVEEKPGSDVLVVAFTGVAARFNAILPFDFFYLTGVLRYHRILLREPWHYCYLKGIDETGLDGLVERLRADIQRLAPKRVIFMGVSSGGYAALLFGHLLGADYIHAFAPYTYLDLRNLILHKWYRPSHLLWFGAALRMNFLPARLRRYLDLRPVLMEERGKRQRLYIHSCSDCSDRIRAEHLQDCPGAKVLLYPCNHHNVTWGLIKNKYLFEVLQEENLDATEKIYGKFYGDFNPDGPAPAGLMLQKG